jgi:hypothetical protein
MGGVRMKTGAEELIEIFRREPILCHELENQTLSDLKTLRDYPHFFESTPGSTLSKLETFPKHITRQMMSKLLARYELFKRILDVHGSIAEVGVGAGNGLFSYAHLSSILEPYNYTRKIIGFDTFSGFTKPTKTDLVGKKIEHMRKGAYDSSGYYENLLEGARLLDANRPLGHLPKIELVKGPVKVTVKKYLRHNPELIVALLALDVGLAEATLPVLRELYGRVPRGGIVTFDTVGLKGFPGENTALHDFFGGFGGLRMERLPFEPARSFFVKE